MKMVIVFLLLLVAVACAPQKGERGAQGPIGPVGLTGFDGKDAKMDVVDPCGPQANGLDEILIRMNNGQIFAFYESGAHRFLALLPPGTYRTTDGTNCQFTVTADGNVQ